MAAKSMIYFLIPVFNEEPNIQELANGLKNALAGTEKFYVLVNDCSTDNTAAEIERCFEGQPYRMLTNQVNSGPGFSFDHGFNFILQNSTGADDLVVTLEGDNTSDLSILPLMVNLAAQWKFDLVLSSVYAQGGGFSQTSFIRKTISLVANQVLRFAYDVKVLTLSSFYRVYAISLLRQIKQRYHSIVSEKGFICAFEVLTKSIAVGAKVIEVPMVLRTEKRKGKSKMKVVKTFWVYLRFLFFKMK